MNEEWLRWFPENPPARKGAKLPTRIPGLKVSIAAIAEVKSPALLSSFRPPMTLGGMLTLPKNFCPQRGLDIAHNSRYKNCVLLAPFES